MPVEVYGKDQTGHFIDIRDLQRDKRNVLLYFYPLDERTEPPRVLDDLEERLPELDRLGTTVVGIRGPPATTEGADLDSVPFPLIEDRDYEMGQGIGLLGRITRPTPPRALVLVDFKGRVKGAWREEGDPAVLDEVVRAIEGG